jgi:threonine dehydratase
MPTLLPSLQGIENALARIRPHQLETPLVRSELLSRALRADVWLKNETVSPIASFKMRGALCALLRAGEARQLTGAVTSSTGNHGQGVAYAARVLGLPADIFLPEVANPIKQAMIKAFGARIHRGGRDIDAAKELARAFAAEGQRAFVDDGESLDMIEGAGTVGLEIARGLSGIDVVFVPMGSGTLASGCAAAIKALSPSTRVLAVQAKGSPAMVASFHARRPVELPADTVADGLMCRVPAELALHALCTLVDDAFTVEEGSLLRAMRTLAESAHVLTEPSGAAGMAAAWDRRDELTNKRVVLVLTGANAPNAVVAQALATEPFFLPEDCA